MAHVCVCVYESFCMCASMNNFLFQFRWQAIHTNLIEPIFFCYKTNKKKTKKANESLNYSFKCTTIFIYTDKNNGGHLLNLNKRKFLWYL